MCLISKDNRPEIAKENILCYKLIIKEKHDCSTPFIHYPIPNPPCVLEAQGEPITEEWRDIEGDTYFFVDKGFIHSYGKLWKGFINFDLKGGAIFAAVIPKGTLYYRGLDDDYASRELKIGTEVCDGDNYNEDNMMFCEVEGKKYTVGDIKDLIRKCVVFKDRSLILEIGLNVELPRDLMGGWNVCGDLKDSTIKMNYNGFFVTHQAFSEPTDCYDTHVVYFSCVEKLIKGKPVIFDCLEDETTN